MNLEDINSLLDIAEQRAAPMVAGVLSGSAMQGQVIADAFRVDIRTKDKPVDKVKPAVIASLFVSAVFLALAATKLLAK